MGVSWKLGSRLYRDAGGLPRLRTLGTQARSISALLSASFHGVDDHDGALEKDCGILATVCRAVCGVFTQAMVGRISSISNAVAGGSAGGAETVPRSRRCAVHCGEREHLA